MTPDKPDEKTERILQTGALARVEGEGGMYVATENGAVVDVQLRIYEPPRFFEAFLQGRGHTEPPDITARICGICPVAYQMSSCAAIEDACGVVVGSAIEQLRRLLYCGEWIESHVLHIYFLHAPDFLGLDSAVEMAATHREILERGLQLKKAGNEIVRVLGGRPIHPINVRVGGFYRAPTTAELTKLRGVVDNAADAAMATVEWVAGFDFPDETSAHELVAVLDPDGYPMIGDELLSSTGGRFPAAAFLERYEEFQVPHSTALHARPLGGGSYLTGPRARYGLLSEALPEGIRRVARDAGLDATCPNPFKSIIVRAVEVLYACVEAVRIIDAWVRPASTFADVPARAGVGHGVTEAPRGMLYHRYQLDETGNIIAANIVPPTSQNQPVIERELWELVESNIDLDDAELSLLCEQAIRNHDPCISCSTHFLDLVVDRR